MRRPATRIRPLTRLIRVVAFGAMVCAIAAVTLVVAPGFRPTRIGLGRRFLSCFWCFGPPVWAGVELATLAFAGRLYP